MADRNAFIERRESGSETGRGVAVDEHSVGTLGAKHIPHAHKNAARDVEEVLAMLHDGQVVVWCEVECLKHLVEHLSVLT